METGYEWDAEIPGLGIRLNARRRVWVLKYRVEGKQHWATLGEVDDLPIDEARALARRYRRTAKAGQDPLPEARKKTSMEFHAFCELYMERHSRRHKRSWFKDEQLLRCHAIPAFKGKQLHDIKRNDIAEVHRKIGSDRPYAANRVRELLHTMFKLARSWEIVEETHVNPANGITDFKEKKRTRWLSSDEVKRVISVIETLPSKAQRCILWIYLTAGTRRSEPLTLRWTEIDFERGEIHIPQTKSGRPHCLPLPPFLMAMIKALPRVSDWVFPGAKLGDHFKRIDKVWTRVRDKAGLGKDVTLHCLRHTVGSWLAQSGVPLRVVGDVLNHVDYKSTLVYAHYAHQNLKDALGDHAARLEKLI